MASNDFSFSPNGAFETVSDENQRPTMEETASILEDNHYAQIWCQSLWSTPNDHESAQEASYVAEPVKLTELKPPNSFPPQDSSSSWDRPQPAHLVDVLQTPNGLPGPQNLDQLQPSSSSETQAPMQASLQPLYPMQSQLYEPLPYYQQWPQYAMPPLPLDSDSMPMTPPSDPRSELKVIRPVAKKQGAAKATTAPRAKPYAPRASKQPKTKATVPQPPEVQPPQTPTTPTQQQLSAEINAPKLTILSPDNIRAISFDTTGHDLPNVLQQNNTIKAVTNVPEDPAYPEVQLMSNGTETLPVLVYDGTRVEMPIYKHDLNNVRVNLDKPLPRAPTQEPVIVTFIFDNDFMTSIKVCLN